MFEYQAEVIRVVDGDTVWLNVDLGCDTYHRLSIRLYGINCPELHTPEGQVARDFVLNILPPGKQLTLQTVKDKREKYGRYLGVLLVNEINLNQKLVELGLAKEYYP